MLKNIPVKICRLFFLLVMLLTFVSVNQWSTMPIGNLWSTWTIRIVFILAIFKYKDYLFPLDKTCKPLKRWLLWTFFCIVHGIFIAENYWEWKQLINNGLVLFIPIFMWMFCRPDFTQYIYRNWYKYGLIAFALFFYWTVGPQQFYLSPLLLLFCFFPLFERKWGAIIFFAGLVYALCMAEDARSQFIKGMAALAIGVCTFYAYKISYSWIKRIFYIGFLSTGLLFTVVLSDASGLILGNISESKAVSNNENRDNVEKDTRSLIFYDVYTSALNHDYWLAGHSPARGNEVNISYLLYRKMYEDVYFNKNERHRNEMLHLNIFTWTGLIGLVLYAVMYMRASWLAVFRSNNRYIALLGCYVAFRWSYGWIEDTNDFCISDIALWTMIAMCYSPYFREMDAGQFKCWIKGLIGK